MGNIKTIALVFLMALICGCASGVIVPAETAIKDFSLNESKDQVFDSALIVAQSLNLDVSVLEKDSGLIRFETAALNPPQLQKYCVYPAVNPSTGVAWDTFGNWNTRSLQAGTGPVRGRVSISILITEQSSTSSNINMRSNWVAFSNSEELPCNSTGSFEEEYIQSLRVRLKI